MNEQELYLCEQYLNILTDLGNPSKTFFFPDMDHFNIFIEIFSTFEKNKGNLDFVNSLILIQQFFQD